jgi:ELWxxDGT repeat protein
VQSMLAVGGGALLLSADAGGNGYEPWVSDGTAAGTRQLADLYPGALGSDPSPLGVAGGLAYFVAQAPLVGRELHAVPLATLAAASVQPIVGGCDGSLGRPDLSTNGAPQLGATAFAFAMDGARPSVLTALLLGDRLGRSDLLGCDVAPAGATATVLGLASVGGAATFVLPIPNVPGLLGVSLTTQGFALDSATARGFAGSNGVFLVVGG